MLGCAARGGLGCVGTLHASLDIEVFLKDRCMWVTHPTKNNIRHDVSMRNLGGAAATCLQASSVALAWAGNSGASVRRASGYSLHASTLNVVTFKPKSN